MHRSILIKAAAILCSAVSLAAVGLYASAAETETLLAHNLADMVGSIVMFVGMLVMMFLFDWRMGAACLMAAVISIGTLCFMMGGKNAARVKEFYEAQDEMSKAATEYVRGIPVVKVFQQTVYSFKAFKEAIMGIYVCLVEKDYI